MYTLFPQKMYKYDQKGVYCAYFYRNKLHIFFSKIQKNFNGLQIKTYFAAHGFIFL
jgi:hypothetical protein